MIDVRVISRKEAEAYKADELPQKTAIISFYDPIDSRTPKGYHRVDYSGLCDNVFYVEIRDIDIEILGKYGLTYDTYFPEAAELARFIAHAVANHDTILCQCEYGQSRSAACAAAIKEFYEKSGIQIFANYKYYPNQLIFNKLLEALIRNGDPFKNGCDIG